jgi:hypothetical protein
LRSVIWPFWFWILCSVWRSFAMSRPLAWALAFVGEMFEARLLPSVLFCHPVGAENSVRVYRSNRPRRS